METIKYAPEQNIGTQETATLCKCNNCGKILIDENPQTGAPKFELTGDEETMEYFEEADEFFYGCPKCKTDAFLMDLQDVVNQQTEQPNNA